MRSLLLLFCLFGCFHFGKAQTNTWTGATDTDWHKSCNWDLGSIPTCSDTVIIPNVTNDPLITGTAHCKMIQIQASSGAALTTNVSGGGILYVSSTNSGGCGGTTATDNGGCSIAATCMTFGGAGVDYGYSVIQTSDGGYAIGGYTSSYGAGSNDMYLIKLDANAAIQWTRTVGGAGNDGATSMSQTSDGGYIMSGTTQTYGAGGVDAYIAKLDASGNVSWTRTVGGGVHDYAESIIQTSDGGYIAVGNTNSYGAGQADVYVIKLTAAGAVSWTRTIGGASSDIGYSIVQATDGGYVMAGMSSSYGPGGGDVYIVKLDASGAIVWTRAYGHPTSGDWGHEIINTSDGGYAVAGYVGGYGTGTLDMYVLKLTSTGTLSWSTTIGTILTSKRAYAIEQTSDGGYIVTGNSQQFGGATDGYIAKLNSSGTFVWGKTYGPAGTSSEVGSSVIQTGDGGYLIGGTVFDFLASYYDIYFVKVDSDGTFCCEVSSTGTGSTGALGGTGGVLGGGGVSGSGGSSGSGGVVNVSCP